MDLILKQFLEEELQLPYQVIEKLQNATIEKVEYLEKNKDKKSQIFIFINLEQTLPFKTYLEIKKQIEQSIFNIKIIYKTSLALYYKDSVISYYKYFVQQYADNGMVYSDVLNFEFEQNELSVNYINEGIQDMYKVHKNKIERCMELVGFKIDYVYKVVEDEDINKKLETLTKTNTVKMPMKAEVHNYSNDNNSNNIQNQKRTFFKKSLTDLSKYEPTNIKTLYEEENDVCIEGYIFDDELKETRNKKHIQTLKITDYTDSILMKRFEGRGLNVEDLKEIKKGMWVRAIGQVKFDDFTQDYVLFLEAIQPIKSKEISREDNSLEKRVELHLHTNMSTMDGISHITDYIKLAKAFNHTAIAITDHNNIQAFPEAQMAISQTDIKPIYGMEASIVDETTLIVENASDDNIQSATYVFFDLETTGLRNQKDKIIEIGAVKYENGIQIDSFDTFVNPQRKIPETIKDITNITDYMVEKAPLISEVLPKFMDFIKDSVLVAHNASFDMGFLQQALLENKYDKCSNTVVDTLLISRSITKKGYHNLGACAKRYKVAYDSEGAHRADYDAMVLASVYEGMKLDLLEKHQVTTFNDINKKMISKNFLIGQRSQHLSILAKNQKGLKDLFKLVTLANTEYFSNEPKLYKSVIDKYRNDLLIGSGCSSSEIYNLANNANKQDLQKAMQYYDYIEVLPPDILHYQVDLEQYQSIQELEETTRYIIESALEINKIVVATGDVHYTNPILQEFRNVYVCAPRTGGGFHPLYDRKNRIKQMPKQHYKTTQEMLDSFQFLKNDKLIKEIVIINTNKIADSIEEVKPIKDGLSTPKIEGVDDKLTDMCYQNAYAQYGNPLPDIVLKRLEKELNSIIKHGFSVVYYISSKLVVKSLEDGYLVGSRGSVGSSFVATMANITEVNPLAAHYYCPHCQFSEFFEDGSILSGYDLPNKKCPKCGKDLIGDGQDIPFETFLGFEGDKVPDIDLNFSGEYQANAHDYTKVLFGEEYVYKAGTIQTVQEKTAFGYVKGYFEKNISLDPVRKVEMERIAQGCAGVKRTTGQHPGGIIVIPDYMDVHDFTPVNFPADDVNARWKTTHFDFHAIHDNVLKLDILGHVDPTAIRMLQDLTDVDPKSIPTNDEKVISLFSSNDALGISDLVNYKNAAIGIPEFGTSFVRGMLEETNPKSFAELVQISGLSHGTDVWLNNAQSLIKRGICTLSEVIGCRDDIMVYLMYKGLKPKLAFTIMESVRKGKGLKEEWIENMKENNVPEWYIDSCLKIKYMFPKAHAVAYVLMAIRVAWFKVYYPLEYYATYFTTRQKSFDIYTMTRGLSEIEEKMAYIKSLGYEATEKEISLFGAFEVCVEMLKRGYKIKTIDLNKSQANSFVVDHEEKAIIPFFKTIDNLADLVAQRIVDEAKIKPFISRQDLQERTGLNNNHMMYLEKIGSLENLQELNQMSLELF
ncbi:PolC-type DNA polymerase III [Mycoplasma sp. P36-A1]|uniref:PolC-type DNA polymerase III n=1 Tax=Mycoplasma sp. P36-A1 TaxID=3252900 RepID=UPI003C2F60D4